MSLYFRYVPTFVQKVFNKRLWRVDSSQKIIYLTFDDGPHPTLTNEILKLLSKYRAKVTFFHLGSKVAAYRSLHQKCRDDGHQIGNHGFHHLDAFKTRHKVFIRNIDRGAEIIKSDLYRPAFGRLPLKGRRKLLKNQNVIMWEIMPGDFAPDFNVESSKKMMLKKVRAGSIITLHENDKSQENVIPLLQWILKTFTERGYDFHALKGEERCLF